MEIIGAGATCAVFKATDKNTKQVFALKRVEWERHTTVINEVEIMKVLNHKHIVKYYESYREGIYVYIVMEYLENSSVFDLVKYLKGEGIYMTEPQIAYIIRGIVEGLKYMHSKNIIHMDIKPLNVLIGDGKVKIIDFGCSVKLKSKRAKCKNFKYIGTLRYLAPEVLRKIPYNFKADVWSVGMTLVEMINGEVPYHESSDRDVEYVVMQKKLPKLERLGEYSELTKDFLRKAIRFSPSGFRRARPEMEELAEHPLLKLPSQHLDVFCTMESSTIAATAAFSALIAKQKQDIERNKIALKRT